MTGIKLSHIFLDNFKGDTKLRRMDVTSLESRVSHLGHIDAIKAALTLISLSSEIRNRQAELAQLYDAHNKLSYLRSFTGTLSVSQQINWAEIWYQIALRAEKQTFTEFNFLLIFEVKRNARYRSPKKEFEKFFSRDLQTPDLRNQVRHGSALYAIIISFPFWTFFF